MHHSTVDVNAREKSQCIQFDKGKPKIGDAFRRPRDLSNVKEGILFCDKSLYTNA